MIRDRNACWNECGASLLAAGEEIAFTLLLAGCSGCGKPSAAGDAGQEPGRAVLIPPGLEARGGQLEAGPAVLPEATIVERGGTVGIERSPETLLKPVLAEKPYELFVGDFLTTGADGTAVLDLGMDTELELAPSTRIAIGVHRPYEIEVHSGTVGLSGPAIKGSTRRFVLTTPGGVVFYAGPSMTLSVAMDGSVLVDVADCPPAAAPPAPPEKAHAPTQVQAFRCSFLASQAEEELVTGDRLLVEPGARVSRSRMDAGGPAAAAWIAGRGEAFAADPRPAVTAFASWLSPAMTEIADLVKLIDANRIRNQELIKQLRDLRQQGKPDGSADIAKMAAEKGAGQDPGITAVKDELVKSSAEQFRLRSVLLARYDQISLGMEILGGKLTDADLAAAGKSLDGLRASMGGLAGLVSGILDRPPRLKVVNKPVAPFVKKAGVADTPKKGHQN